MSAQTDCHCRPSMLVRAARAACEGLESRLLFAPLSSLPLLSSLPEAPVTVHLDFDGTPPFEFNSSDGTWASGPLPGNSDPILAFSIDGNVNDYTDAEINAINEIWQHVSEKFSPFNINVTTIAPPNYNNGVAIHAIMGGSAMDWSGGGGGGIAPLNAFTNSRPNSAFTFTVDAINGLNGGGATLNGATRHFIGETAAHEIGHTLGLQHQSVVNGSVVNVEYSNGNATTAPIMGNSSNNSGKRGLWYQGQTSARDANDNLIAMGFQDDLNTITRPGNVIQYRADDFGSFGGSGALTVFPDSGVAVGNGIIETNGDQDAFLFNAIGPTVQFTVRNALHGGMLAPTLELIPLSGSAGGNVSVTTTNTSATLTAINVTPGGGYLLIVSRQGSEYGSLGQYQIDGNTGAFAGLAAGVITVNGYNTNNDLLISYISSTDQIVLQDNVFGGQAVQQFPRSQVTRINVQFTQGTDDTIDVLGQFSALNIPIQINAGGGTDTLVLSGTSGNDSMSLHTFSTAQLNNTPITFSGIERSRLNGFAGNDTFSITQSAIPVTLLGGAGDDTFTLGTGPTDFLTITSPVSIFGDTGSDRLNVGSGFAQAVAANVSFDGGDGFNTIYFNDTSNTATAEYEVNGSTITYHGFAPPCNVSYANVSQIEMHGGSGNDSFIIRNNVAPIVRSFGNGGNDSFTFGDGLLAPLAGVVFNGGPGDDTLVFDDHNNPAARTWHVFNDRVIFAGAFVFQTEGFEGVGILAGQGGDTVDFAVQTFSQEITVDAGLGNDLIRTNGAIIPSLTVRGGGGTFDNLQIDDRGFPAGGSSFSSVYVDRITRIYAPAPQMNLNYDGIEGIVWNLPQKINEVQVFGVSSNIPGSNSFQILGNALADTYLIYPTHTTANIGGPLYVTGGSGGNDLAALIDDGVAPGTYSLQNPVGGAQFIYGSFVSGAGYIGVESTIETLSIYGGNGNDTFQVDKYTSGIGLNLFGRNGDDTCTIGNGDMSANLTNASAFTFDGGAGSDRFTIANGVTNVPWTYQLNNGSIISSRTGYSWHSLTPNIESQYIFAGSNADTFNIDSVPSGVYTECNGFGGVDSLRLGTANLHVTDIRGPISYNAGANGGTVVVSNGGGLPATVHQDANTIGAYTGDNLFGPGGSLTFSGVTNSGTTPGVWIVLRSNSTCYAQPLATAQVSLTSGLLFENPSGSVKLATAGVQNPVINGTSASGSITSSNRQTLSWFNFTGAIEVDNVAPAMIAADINLNGIPGPGRTNANRQSVDVRFSEDVSALIGPGSLVLSNLTTSQTVPSANVAVSYDHQTNTAHFTFPGYPLGILPDGNYSAKILAGLPDFFGNAMPADAPFTFFFLRGDANHDRKVDVADLGILATNWQQTGRTFSQADFNYDGIVDVADLGILASSWQKELTAPAPAFAPPVKSPRAAPSRVATLVL